MTCARCRNPLGPAEPCEMAATVKRTKVHFIVQAPKCSNCGKVAIIGKTLDLYARRAADAYRLKVGLWTARDIVAAKMHLRLSWPKFAEFVGVSLVQLKRWLAGGIQSRAMDELLRLKTDIRTIERHLASLRSRDVYAKVPLHQDLVSSVGGAGWWLELEAKGIQAVSLSTVKRYDVTRAWDLLNLPELPLFAPGPPRDVLISELAAVWTGFTAANPPTAEYDEEELTDVT